MAPFPGLTSRFARAARGLERWSDGAWPEWWSGRLPVVPDGGAADLSKARLRSDAFPDSAVCVLWRHAPSADSAYRFCRGLHRRQAAERARPGTDRNIRLLGKIFRRAGGLNIGAPSREPSPMRPPGAPAGLLCFEPGLRALLAKGPGNARSQVRLPAAAKGLSMGKRRPFGPGMRPFWRVLYEPGSTDHLDYGRHDVSLSKGCTSRNPSGTRPILRHILGLFGVFSIGVLLAGFQYY